MDTLYNRVFKSWKMTLVGLIPLGATVVTYVTSGHFDMGSFLEFQTWINDAAVAAIGAAMRDWDKSPVAK